MPYPTYNPFDIRAVSTIETAAPGTPTFTLERPAVKSLARIVHRYQSEWHQLRSPGRAIALIGPYGSGKTHTLNHVLQNYLPSQGDVTKPYTIYFRLDDPTLLSAFRRLVGSISQTDLTVAIQRATAALVSEDLATPLGADQPTGLSDMSARLMSDPALVSQLFDSHTVAQTDVRSRGLEEVKALNAPRDDLLRVVPLLMEPTLSTAAYSWLAGVEVDPRDLVSLGVTAPVGTEMMRAILQFIASVFRRAKWPLIIALDQVEMLTWSKSSDDPSHGFLRAMTEVLPAEGALFIASMNDEAFASLGDDTRQRFPQTNVFELPGLELEEAKGLVELHLGAEASSPDRLFPFTDGGVRQILDASAGNVRMFLQRVYAVLDQALPTQALIDSRFVLEVLAQDGWKPSTREETLAILDGTLRKLGAHFTPASSENRDFDFIVENSLGQPDLVIEVKSALFGADEARQAKDAIERFKALRSSVDFRVTFVLVMVNYSSPEVRAILSHAADEIISAKGDDLRESLTAYLDKLSARLPGGPGSPPELFDAVVDRLSELDEARTRDQVELEARVSDFHARQSSSLDRAETLELKNLWATERAKLEARIEDQVLALRSADLGEMEDARATAERARVTRVLVPSVVVGAISTVTLFVMLAVGSGTVTSRLPLFAACAVLGLAAWAVACVSGRWLVGYAVRELAGPVTSVEQLERLAQAALVRHRLVPWGGGDERRWIYSRNPHFRYAGALAIDSALPSLSFERNLRGERCAIIRRHLVRRLVLTLNESDSEEVLNELARKDAIEPSDWSVCAEFQLIPDIAIARWTELGVLAALNNQYTHVYHESLAAALAHDAMTGHPPEHMMDDRRARLANAFLHNDEGSLREAAATVSERDVRHACHLLSAFHPRGLRSYYWISRTNEVQELFMFFSRLLLYMSRGVGSTASGRE